MRYAIISDIHSNLEALDAVLTEISNLMVDEILCLGDIVGYNANPNECVEVVRKTGITCIRGNHDIGASDIEEPAHFNPPAKEALLWTRKQLTDENKRFLSSLPRELKIEDIFLFHGFIHETDHYIASEDDALYNFQLLESLPGEIRLGFYGHTHVKAAVSLQRGKVILEEDDMLKLSPWKKYLINPGSIGQPRDNEPSASFMVYNTIDEKITFHRVDYDIAAAQKKIIEAGLPAELAHRLLTGR